MPGAAMPQPTPPYGAIWGLLKRGEIVPILGPGASLSGRSSEMSWSAEQPVCLPNGVELAGHLAREAIFPDDQQTDLAKVAQYVRVMMGRPLLRQWLHDIFAQDYPYAPLHELLADVPANLLILTTNY